MTDRRKELLELFEQRGWSHFAELLRDLHRAAALEFAQANSWEAFIAARAKLAVTRYVAELEDRIRNADL